MGVSKACKQTENLEVMYEQMCHNIQSVHFPICFIQVFLIQCYT